MGQIRRFFKSDLSFDVVFTAIEDGVTQIKDIPEHVKIEYFTDRNWDKLVVERNGRSTKNCKVNGSNLTVYLPLSTMSLGTGELKCMITEYVKDTSFPGGERAIAKLSDTNILLWTGEDSTETISFEHIIDSTGVNVMAEPLTITTYSELREMRNNGELIAGMRYRITDFVTQTAQANTRSAGHQFDIIVIALDERTLSDNAMAIQHEGDSYFANNNLAAWQVWYDFDNNTTLRAWSKKTVDMAPQMWSTEWGVLDSNYDPSNPNSKGYRTVVVNGKTKYIYRPSSTTEHLNDKEFYELIKTDSITTPDGLIFEADSAPYYVEDEGYWEWMEICDMRVYTTNGALVATLLSEGDGVFYDSRDEGWEHPIHFSIYANHIDEVYRFTPESGISDWWEYVQGGEFANYSESPYTGTTSSLYYAFDSALPKQGTMVEEVYSSSTGKIYLCRDGVIDYVSYSAYKPFEEGHKGVIYRLIDEFGNDCPYDFKNIQFLNNGLYFYTFDASGDDASLAASVCDNKLEHSGNSLRTTIFKGPSKHNRIQRTTESGVFIFEKSAIYNDIRATNDSAQIAAKGNFEANMLLLRAGLTTNGAFSNNFAQYLSSTMEVVGDMYACQLDTMPRNSVPLNINVGRIQQCVIKGCGTFTITNTNGNTTGAIGYSTINLGMNGSNVKLLWNTTASLNTRIEGLDIKAYNWGTSEVVIDITSRPTNATYPTTIAKDSSNNVKVYCEVDLVK